MMTQYERERARDTALMAYRRLLEHVALLDFLNPSADTQRIIRACRLTLTAYPMPNEEE